MPDKPITLHQLTTVAYTVPENRVLRAVLARGKFGDVKVWSRHEIPWGRLPGSTNVHKLPIDYVDLIVLDDPKVVSMNIRTDPIFDKGVFVSPISMTLAHGLIWVQQWDQYAQSNKEEVLNQLLWMIARVKVNLNYDRYHFTSTLILAFLVTIDRAITASDKLAFALEIRLLYRQDEMCFDPYDYSAGVSFPLKH